MSSVLTHTCNVPSRKSLILSLLPAAMVVLVVAWLGCRLVVRMRMVLWFCDGGYCGGDDDDCGRIVVKVVV